MGTQTKDKDSMGTQTKDKDSMGTTIKDKDPLDIMGNRQMEAREEMDPRPINQLSLSWTPMITIIN